MTDTSPAVTALQAAIAEIDAQLNATPDIDRRIAALQDEIRKLRAQRTGSKAPLRKQRAALAKALTLIAGVAATKPPTRVNVGAFTCDQCDQVFTTPQGRAMHRRRAHDGFDPNKRVAPPARDPGRALGTLRDHRTALAEPVDLDEAAELIGSRAS